jgi:uncharacterized protein YkwD
MRAGIAIAVALVALAITGAAAATATADEFQVRRAASSSMTTLEKAVVGRINQLRRGRGLSPLRLNRRLAAAADYHSRDMGRRGYFKHDSANGTVFWRRIERFYSSRGFRTWTVGENLLWASQSCGADFAVRRWMRSTPHRRNMLSRDWREIGIGAAYFVRAPGDYGGRPVTILTADFGSRA